MARWDTFVWDDGTIWDDEALTDTLAYGLEIDWDGDGNFDGSVESTRMLSWSSFRGRRNMLKSNGAGFESIQTGRLNIVLDNTDDRYTALNTSSPLYPDVQPGKEVRFTIRDMSVSSTVYAVFYGTIDDIIPQGNTVSIPIEDAWRVLRSYPAKVATHEDITPDTAAGLALDSIGWPARWGRDFDAFSDLIPYWWASGNKKASEGLDDLAGSFLSFFFISGSGQARFLARTTVADSAADYYQEELLKDFSNPQPWKNRYNVTQFKTHPRTAAATGTIYQLTGNTPSIQAGVTLRLLVDYKYNNINGPALNVISPVATTDYLMNTNADGSGTNKTANCAVVLTDYGDTARIAITNNDAGPVYVTLLKVRGDAVYETGSADITYPADTDTVALKRQFILDLQSQQDINSAVSFAEIYGPFLDQQNLFPVISIEHRPELQFAPDLFSLVTLTIPQKGIDGLSFRVGGIEHKSDPSIQTCQRVTTTLWLEPYISADGYWTWDTASTFDSTTVFGF